MQDGKQLKYGQISGGEQGFAVAVTATQYIAAASGKFVKRAAAGTPTATLAGMADTNLMGHLEIEGSNSTDGTEVRKCVNDLTAVFRIPINGGTYTTVMRGKTCDLSILANIQGAALDSSSDDILLIVNGDDVNNNWVDVMLNDSKIGKFGVV